MPQQTGKTVEGFQLFAACNILARRRKEEDIRKSRGGARRAEEDEVRRYAFGGASRDDSNVLREVTNQHSDENDADEKLGKVSSSGLQVDFECLDARPTSRQ